MTLALVASFPSEPDVNSLYADILKTHVKDGRVDYRGLAANDLDKLDRYIEGVGTAVLPKNRNRRIGFLIDAYNALVLRSVIQHQRPRSVLDVKDFFKAKVHKVAGQTVSLDQLEKKVLNPYAKDPRTHFVLVCAAVGCPILESKPFLGDNVNRRMGAATRRYLSGPTGARASGGSIAVSKIFDWYAKDFGGKAGVKSFVLKHLSAQDRKKVGNDPTLGFLDYNWTLNQQ
ncbi:MAG: DUF547 domain-containing protein [Myxococcota bacterium]